MGEGLENGTEDQIGTASARAVTMPYELQLYHVTVALRALSEEIAALRDRIDALESQSAIRHRFVAEAVADIQDSRVTEWPDFLP